MKNIRIIFIGLISVYMLFLFSSCSEADKSLKKAEEAYLESDYISAVRFYRLSISQGQRDESVYIDEAIALLKLERYEEAKNCLQTGLKLCGDDKKALKKAGIYYFLAGDLEKSKEYFLLSLPEENEKRKKHDPETYAFVGEIYLLNGEYKNAIRIFEYLITEGQYTIESEIKAGDSYLGLNMLEAACAYYDMAETNGRVNPYHYLHIYLKLCEKGFPVTAKTYLEKGLKLCENPESGISKNLYLYIAGKDFIEENIYDDAESFMLLAKKEMTDGNYLKAEEYLEKATMKDPANAAVFAEYYRCEILKEDYEKAGIILKKLEALGDESVMRDVAWNTVIMYEKMRDFEKASQTIREYKEKYPEDIRINDEYNFIASRVLN